MYRGFTIRIYPTKEQEARLLKTRNAVIWSWNWALALQMEKIKNNEEMLSAFDLGKKLTVLRNKEEYSWLREVSYHSCKQSAFDLDKAFTSYFQKQKSGEKFTKKTIARAERTVRPLNAYDRNGHPKFKSKYKSNIRIPFRNDKLYFEDGKVSLIKVGKVKYKSDFDIPQGQNACKFYNPRVSYDNGKWTLAFAMEQEIEMPELNDFCSGVDLGVKTLATISCDSQQMQSIPNINKTNEVRRLEKRLKREQRKAARRVKGSSNQRKMYKQIHKTYAKIKNIRHNHNHQATHKIVNMLPKAIGIEDLNVSGMMKNRKLSKAIGSCSFHAIRNQLEYKAEKYGIAIAVANRFYPSSKICSSCGNIHKNLKLRDRVYVCEKCGLEIDRDYNAALNLEQLAQQQL